MTRTNYIFVDYENVHRVDLDLVAEKPVEVEIIVGKQTKSVPLKLAQQLKHSPQVEMIEADCAGDNACDLVLAFRIGLKACEEPSAYFHIVSGDRKHFDPLVEHLTSRGISARRDDTFEKAFDWTTKIPTAPEDRFQIAKKHLVGNKKSRPKRKKTLLAQINAYFGKELGETELEALLQQLIRRRVIKLTETGGVTYTI